MISLIPSEITATKLQGYLQSAVAPRPIAFASTVDPEGNPNLAPFSFLMCSVQIHLFWFFRLHEECATTQ